MRDSGNPFLVIGGVAVGTTAAGIGKINMLRLFSDEEDALVAATPTPTPSATTPVGEVVFLDFLAGSQLWSIAGVVIVVFALFIVLVGLIGLFRAGHTGMPAAPGVTLLGLGGVMGSLGFFIHYQAGKTPADAEPTPSATPSAPATDPVVLPPVQNLGVIWTYIGLTAAVVAILAAVYFFTQKVRRDRLTEREEENRRREEEERARKLAEEEARRLARIAAHWAKITDLHAELKRRVVDAETDWDMLFDMPALSDVSYRQTRALHRAMRDAENAAITMPDGFTADTPLSGIPYVKKVRAFQSAWDAAYTFAKKLGTAKLPAAEIRTIARIRTLLILAEGSGASEHERATAYDQIRKLLGDLRVVQLPPRALDAIEARRVLAITAEPEVMLATAGEPDRRAFAL